MELIQAYLDAISPHRESVEELHAYIDKLIAEDKIEVNQIKEAIEERVVLLEYVQVNELFIGKPNTKETREQLKHEMNRRLVNKHYRDSYSEIKMVYASQIDNQITSLGDEELIEGIEESPDTHDIGYISPNSFRVDLPSAYKHEWSARH